MEKKERWFLIRTNTDFFSIGTEEGSITFAPDRQIWMVGKTLEEIKPFIKEGKGMAFELKPEGHDIYFDVIFKIGKR